MEASVYNVEGKVVRSVKVPEKVFGATWNADMVHQVVTSMRSNEREVVAHTKDRGEVAGGGKKPWRQKGTGRARHGSIRSPIWVGGGVAHGPNNKKNYARKVNRDMKARALYSVLSRKYKDGEVLFVDSISYSEPKAKLAKATLQNLASVKGFDKLTKKPANAALIALTSSDKKTSLSLRNFSNIKLGEVRNLNPVEVLSYKYLIISDPEKAFETLTARTNK